MPTDARRIPALPRKGRIYRRRLPLTAACALLAMMLVAGVPTSAQTTAPVNVDVVASDKQTRLTFEFNRLTGYKVLRNGQSVTINFDTPASLALSSTTARRIESISATKPDAELATIALRLSPGAVLKDYRLQRKVVVDITDTKPAEPPVKAAEKPAPAKKAAEKLAPAQKAQAPVPAPAAAPVDAVEKAPLAEQVAQQNEEEPAPPEADPLPMQSTILSFSTLEPTKIAVFTRDDALWLVLNTTATSAQPPSINGPDAESLKNPQVMKFTGGTALRYALPGKRFVHVEKKNLTWEIALSAVRLHPPATEQISVERDPSSQAVRIIVPLKSSSNVMEFQDPVVGDILKVVATGNPDSRMDQPRRFPDLEVLPAATGLALRPISDDLKLTRIEDFVLISSASNILATPSTGPVLVVDPNQPENAVAEERLFDFPNWRQGGLKRLLENRRALESRIASAPEPQTRAEEMLKLALLYFANGMGPETLGILRILNDENPEAMKNSNIIALRGAAAVLAHHYDDAMNDLSDASIQQHPEVKLWLGYAAAATEQWQKAGRLFPSDSRLLVEYPETIARDFNIYMAESALRLGRTDTAKRLLNSAPLMAAQNDVRYVSAASYLRGEALRQEGKTEDTIRLWTQVANSIDRLYHTKAALALANLELQEKKITLPEAIDRIDSLRFAWRGDGLEVQVLHNLGRLRIQNKNVLQGLNDLRAALKLAEGLLSDPEPIITDMRRAFADIFVGGVFQDVNPVEAVSIYNDFQELLPEGRDRSVAELNFADFLIRIDLLEKAEAVLEKQISGGFPPPEQIPGIGARLAALYLIDGKAEKSLSALNRTERPGLAPAHDEERLLLQARALSQLNRTDEAIASIAALESENARKLSADILWRARKWPEAAAAIARMLPPPNAPLTEETAQLVLNTAVAYKLAGDKAQLESLRAAYQPAMAATMLNTTFAIVTRDGGASELADRATILKTAGEVDMFKDFLETYRSSAQTTAAKN
jgi:hypothetical protein